MVLDAEGRLLGMTSVSPGGDAVVVPHGVIARFVEAATANVSADAPATAPMPQTMTLPTVQPIPQVASRRRPSRWSATATRPPAKRRRTPPAWTPAAAGSACPCNRSPCRKTSRTAPGNAPRARWSASPAAAPPIVPACESGDVLLALDGSSTSGNHALRAFLAPEKIGSQVQVRLMRDGLVHTTVLTIAAQPE